MAAIIWRLRVSSSRVLQPKGVDGVVCNSVVPVVGGRAAKALQLPQLQRRILSWVISVKGSALPLLGMRLQLRLLVFQM
jgi:hypothetical protein